MSKPRIVRINWDCSCGQSDTLSFDLAARPHSRTHECRRCGQVLEIRQPIVLDMGRTKPIGERPIPATGESPKEDPR